MPSGFVENERIVQAVMAKTREGGLKFLPQDHKRLAAAGPIRTYETLFQLCESSMSHLLHLTCLNPKSAILDYGSGIGRMAVPLYFFLEPEGRYFGVDIMKDAVAGCLERFKDVPNFEFRHVDLPNRMYNPKGRAKISAMRRVLPASSFDFAFMNSICTHLLPEDLDGVLQAVRSALKPGAELLVSFFLLTPDSERAIAAQKADFLFEHEHGPARVNDANVHEGAVAYPQTYVNEALQYAGFDVEFVSYGNWANESKHLACGQDLIVCTAV